MTTKWKPHLIPPKGEKVIFQTIPDRSGKSWFWEKWLKAQPKKVEKLREPEVNLITFDEYAEVTPEALKTLRNFQETKREGKE